MIVSDLDSHNDMNTKLNAYMNRANGCKNVKKNVKPIQIRCQVDIIENL